MLDCLFSQFDNIVVLDTETTGLNHKSDEIIELAMLHITRDGCVKQYDEFIRLSPGKVLPPEISQLTGITEEMLINQGVSKNSAAAALEEMMALSKPLIVAYNTQFDIGFLYYLLLNSGRAEVLKNIKLLDAMTIYKDRHPFPHKLCNASETYSLSGQNTHRAIDDTLATYELLCAMDKECDDLAEYINLFGYNPKYGVSGQRVRSVTYLPQGYHNTEKLYTKKNSL